MLLVALPLQVALTLGLGLILCCLHTLFRDTAQLVGLALMGWFYLTPIVYPLSLVPERYQAWLRWNPLTTLVGLYRKAFLNRLALLPYSVGSPYAIQRMKAPTM